MGKFRKLLLAAACLSAACLAVPAGPAAAQVTFGPVVPWYSGGVTPYGYGYGYSPFGYGVYGYGNLGGTAYSNDAMALADVLRAQGNYNRSTAEAAVEVQKARAIAIENQQRLLAAYQENRRRGEQRRAEENAAARERRMRYQSLSHQRPPELLTRGEFNAATGELYFPDALQTPEYADARQRLQDLFAVRVRSGSNPKLDGEIAGLANEMLTALNRQIETMHAPDYIAARNFLEHVRNTANLGTA